MADTIKFSQLGEISRAQMAGSDYAVGYKANGDNKKWTFENQADFLLNDSEAGQEFQETFVKVQDTEPTDENNKIWIQETPESEVEVPTYDEFEDVVEDVENLKSAISSFTEVTKNLFDKSDSSNILNQLYIDSSGNVASNDNTKMIICPCEGSTTYTISKILSSSFRVTEYASRPQYQTHSITSPVSGSTLTKITIKTSATAKYIGVYLFDARYDSDFDAVLNSVQIEKGSNKTDYVSHYCAIDLETRKDIEEIDVELETKATQAEVTSIKDALFNKFIVLSAIDGAVPPAPRAVGMVWYYGNGKMRRITSLNSGGGIATYEEFDASTDFVYYHEGSRYIYSDGNIVKDNRFGSQHYRLDNIFSSSFGEWARYSSGLPATITEESGYARIVVGDGSSISQGLAVKPMNESIKSGDKILISFEVRHNGYIPTNSYPGIYMTGGNVSHDTVTFLCSRGVLNTFEHKTCILTATTNADDFSFGVRASYSSVAQASGASIDIRNINIVNLTKTFGSNVPSAIALDSFIKAQDNKHIENYAIYNESYHNGIRLYNMMDNGDFSNSTYGWTTGSDVAKFNAQNDGTVVMHATSTGVNGGAIFNLDFPMVNGHKYYASAYVDNMSSAFSDTAPYVLYGKIPGYFSAIFTCTRTNYYKPYFRVLDTSKDAIFGNLIMVDLTEAFGEGKEPTNKLILDYILDGMLQTRFFADYIDIDDNADIFTNKIAFAAIPKGSGSITSPVVKYPVLWGVKMTNGDNVDNGYLDSHPVPYAWLYYDKDNPTAIYISCETADNLQPLFAWDKTLVDDYDPVYYAPVMCDNGDIVCVFRNEYVVDSARRNPVIYKHGDYEHPVEIDFGSGLKPTGWFSSCGVEFISGENCFVFGEYTRDWTEPANVWKVTAPYDVVSNWTRVIETHGTGEGTREVEHIHSINFDTFTGDMYAVSGDDASESKMWRSTDKGDTWTIVLQNNHFACRSLNLCFTKEYVYWGSDHVPALFGIKRENDMSVDFSKVEVIADMTNFPDSAEVVAGQTYFSVLIDDPYGVLLLQRNEGQSTQKVALWFYNINKKLMQRITTLSTGNGESLNNGFRCEAANVYQSMAEKRIVCGFGHYPCYMSFPGNRHDGSSNLGNLAITVY